MIDPLALLDNVFSDLDGFENPSVPGFEGAVPDAVPGDVAVYVIDNNDSSRISRSENGDPQKSDRGEARDIAASPENVARTSSYVGSPGTPGTPGNEAKSPAESTSLQFPVKDRKPGTPGTESDVCGQTIPPPGDPLPISPSDVRAGVERELRALAEDGREGPAALRDAVEITRAKIRNSEAMAERQAHGGRCHVCDGPLDDSAPVVAVLSGKRGAHLHLHAGCCAAHSARMAALADKIMVAAGYGAETKGAAA